MLTSPLKWFLSLALLSAAFLLSSCASVDPEFTSGAAGATTSANGNEIVGKWYAYSEHKGILTGKLSSILELYSNGTGKILMTGQASAFMSGQIKVDATPKKVTWNYKGKGVWSFTQQSAEREHGTFYRGTMILSGGRLYRTLKIIMPTNPIIGWGLLQNREIYVRAEDADAISDEHLRNNRNRAY